MEGVLPNARVPGTETSPANVMTPFDADRSKSTNRISPERTTAPLAIETIRVRPSLSNSILARRLAPAIAMPPARSINERADVPELPDDNS